MMGHHYHHHHHPASGGNDYNNNTAVQSLSWSETAFEWLVRSRRKKHADDDYNNNNNTIPHDPLSAAWAFFQGGLACSSNNDNNSNNNNTSSSSNHSYGTGIAYIDEALKQKKEQQLDESHNNTRTLNARLQQQQPQQQQQQQLPIIDIHAGGNYGKTWTIVTLAAKFVAATRASLFPPRELQQQQQQEQAKQNQQQQQPQQQPVLPQVIVLDSSLDITTTKLGYVVISTLLRQQSENPAASMEGSSSDQQLEYDIQSCLSRIHLAKADNISGWVPILESIRCQLLSSKRDTITNRNDSSSEWEPERKCVPTLILWDGFLSEPGSDSISRMEVIRQVTRLLQDCGDSVLLVTTTNKNYYEWDRLVTHKIQLEEQRRVQQADGSSSIAVQQQWGDEEEYELVATVSSNGTKIPYSLSVAGVLT